MNDSTVQVQVQRLTQAWGLAAVEFISIVFPGSFLSSPSG